MPVKAATAPPGHRPLYALILLAFLLRSFYLLQSRRSPFFEPSVLDARYYHEWAMRLLKGDMGGVFYGLPLYPFFLAAVYKVSNASVLAVKWVQLFLGLVTVYFTYRIGEKLFDRRAAFWGALMAALYGPLIFHEGIFIPEAVGIPLYAAALFAAVCFYERPTVKRACLVGALCGLAALTKAGILVFFILYAIWFVWKNGSPAKIRTIAAASAALLLTLAPVTAHNVIRGKDLVFLTSHAGFNFYSGNHPGAEGVFSAPEGTGSDVESQKEDSRALAEKAIGRPLKPSEVSKYWSARAWDYIFSHPVDFLALSLRKTALFFDSREISDVQDYAFSKNFTSFLKFPWPDFRLLGPLVFLGLVAARRSRYPALVYLWTASYLTGMLFFFVNARYRLPMLPLFFPLAVFGLLDLHEAGQKRNSRRIAAGAAALLAGIYISQLHLVGTNFSRDYLNAGDALAEKGMLSAALPLYERALKIDPQYAKAELAIGLTLARLDRSDEAEEHYERALSLGLPSAQAWNNLGLLYEKKGDLERAESAFSKAVELRPGYAQAHNNLGMVYGKRGEVLKASAEFERSLELNPSSASANTNLGMMFYQKGDREKAKALVLKALQIDPNFPPAQKASRLLDSFDSP